MRSNLIPITKIYDIYPKYTYSDDVKKFMDEIVDIDYINGLSNISTSNVSKKDYKMQSGHIPR